MFNEMAQGIRSRPIMILALFTFVALFVVGCGLFVEDYTTSLLGYKAWPTEKANVWVIYMVAALPQLAQVAFAYTALDRRSGFALVMMLVFWAWDLTSDVYFKSRGFESSQITVYATAESTALYTLGSEVLIAFAGGMIVQIFRRLTGYNLWDQVEKPNRSDRIRASRDKPSWVEKAKGSEGHNVRPTGRKKSTN